MGDNDYFAFSDVVATVGRRTFVRFDAIHVKALDDIIRIGDFRESIHRIRPLIFELVFERGGYRSFRGLEGRRIVSDRWYRILIDRGGIPASLFASPDQPEGEPTGITDIGFLDRRHEPSASLEDLISLNEVPDSTEDEIREAISIKESRPAFVGVYSVGQGSCNAVCDGSGIPLLYYDFGGGITQNAHTYPNNLQFCFCKNPTVVLSHWDMDHWVSGDRHPAAKRLKWVVPRQQMGVTHLKFAAELYSRGNLLIWPENTSELSFDGGRVWKLPRHGNRNYSGIVMLVDTHSGGAEASVLITGDAPYNRVPEGTMGGLHGLVVTHHGGTFREGDPGL